MAEALEKVAIPATNLNPTRIALGAWAIGGSMWGGSDEAESIRTIRSAVDRGINLIDTAPVYGFGHSEEIVGRALEEIGRHKVLIATKVGLDWRDGEPFRDGSGARIHKEIEESLRRLRTDNDPKFQPPRLQQYLRAVERLDAFAREIYGKRVLHLAVRWVLDRQPLSIALWGARHPAQLDEVTDIMGWKLDAAALAQIGRIVTDCVSDPVGPEFMAPPARLAA